MSARSYWPCTLVEHASHASIVFSDFELLEHHFSGKEGGGYAVEALVKRLARTANPELLRRVTFDSEASLFCALGEDREALFGLAELLARATGTTEAEARLAAPLARDLDARTDAEARACLLRGFVVSADPESRRRFVELVPDPPLTSEHERWLATLETDPGPARRCEAAKRWARLGANTRFAWSDPLSDPRVLDRIAARLAIEIETSVLVEIVSVLVNAVTKHLAYGSLAERCEPLLVHPSAAVRHLALTCVGRLSVPSWDAILPAFDDRDPKVRVAAVAAAELAELPIPTSGLTHDWYMRSLGLPDEVHARVIRALADKNGAVRGAAARALATIDRDGAVALVEAALAREKTAAVRIAIQTARDRLAYGAAFRPCRMQGAMELFRFNRLARPGLDGPDVERILREGHAELLKRAEVASRRGYFAAWGPDENALRAIAAAIRAIR